MRHTMELALGMVKKGSRDPQAVANFVQEELIKLTSYEGADRPHSVAEILHSSIRKLKMASRRASSQTKPGSTFSTNPSPARRPES